MKISIITPTYNRGYLLGQCYNSLIAQTNKDFEWIIVDDGSTDNTYNVVQSFIKEGKVNINYIKQSNGGKHRAHNTGVKAASGCLTVCLDSDDVFTPNAIYEAIDAWQNLKYNNIIGILALRGDFNNKPICSALPNSVNHCTMTSLRDDYGFKGDTVLFFSTSILKEHLFREFVGEKFLTEFNLYDELDKLGEMLLIDKVLYLCEYLPDGLTAKYHKLMQDNPKGSADTYYRMSLSADNLWMRLKYSIISQSYLSLVEDKNELSYFDKSAITLLSKLLVPFFKKRFIK